MAVYSKQYGRLGNNLFQKAAAIGYAMKHGLEYDISPWSGTENINRGHPFYIKESGHHYQEVYFDPAIKHRNIVLDGYFQSEKYFAHCREEVIKAFGFPWELKKGWCSIHVRRGDYLKYPDKHPVVSSYYMMQTPGMIAEKTGTTKFMIFSDDVDYCKRYYMPLADLWGYQFEYSEGKTAEEDLILGSCCEHNIISNSTFSWWQAWLNQNPHKVVISPSKDNWFGPANKHLDTSNLIPDSWIHIKY